MRRCICGCTGFYTRLRQVTECDVKLNVANNEVLDDGKNSEIMETEYINGFICEQCGMKYDTLDEIPDDNDMISLESLHEAFLNKTARLIIAPAGIACQIGKNTDRFFYFDPSTEAENAKTVEEYLNLKCTDKNDEALYTETMNSIISEIWASIADIHSAERLGIDGNMWHKMKQLLDLDKNRKL